MIRLHFKFRYPRSLHLLATVALLGLGACGDRDRSGDSDQGAGGEEGANGPTAASVLKDVVAAPGVDLWLGDESVGLQPVPAAEKKRFPLYAIRHHRFAVSSDHLERVRAHREALIPELRSQIEDAARAAFEMPLAKGDSEETSPVPVLETELVIALDLNAVELLGLMTGTAMQLQTYLQSFESDDLEAYLETSHAELHRNLLGAMSGILRQEGFDPIVNERWTSAFTFEKALNDGVGNLLDEGSLLDDSPPPEMPVAGFAPFTTTFSQQLIDWSRDYLESTEKGGRKGENGIEQPVPVLR